MGRCEEMTAVSVLIVHHEHESRRAVRGVVTAAAGFHDVAEAASAESAIELVMTLRPSLALVGASMPGIDGFETSRRMAAARPETAVVVLDGTDSLTPTSLQALWETHETG
jgi:DNA-binding NarL/FixJ family response regulator